MRTLTATVVLVGSLAGCAAGLHDETSRERSTPYVAGANVGALKVRDVVVIAAPSGSSTTPSPSASPSSVGGPGETQGFLTLVLVNDGNAPDSITGLQVGSGGGVTPTDPTASGTVDPNTSLIFGGAPAAGSTTPANNLAISGLSSPLVPGTTVKVTLMFQNAGQVSVSAPVVSAPGS
jgi:hypothetical protein